MRMRPSPAPLSSVATAINALRSGLPADYPFFFSASSHRPRRGTSIAPAPGAPSLGLSLCIQGQFGLVTASETRTRCRPRALAPFFCVVTVHIARNHSRSGLRVSVKDRAGGGGLPPAPRDSKTLCAPAKRAHAHTLDSGNPLASARRTDSRGKPPRSQSEVECELVARVSLHQVLHYILGSPESSGYRSLGN